MPRHCLLRLARPSLALALSAALALSSACEKKGGLRLLVPGIDVSPTTLDFGQGAVGSTQQLWVNITNTGTANLTVTGLAVAEDPNGELLLASQLITDCKNAPRAGGLTLSPSDCARFAVRWSPKATHAAVGKISVGSDDPDHAQILIPITGNGANALLRVCALKPDGTLDPAACSKLEGNPPFIPSLDWGVVSPNQAITRTLRVFNDGTANLLLDPAGPQLTSVTPGDFKITGAITLNQISPGLSADLPLAVTAHANGALRGGLVLISNDQRQRQIEVPLLAVVQGWRLCVDPAAGLDFGSVPVGQTRTSPLTMRNCGSVDFNLKSLVFGPYPPTTTEFTLGAGQLPATPAAFPAGAEVKLDVTYKPTAIRSDSASLDVQIEIPAQNGQPPQLLVDSWPIVGKGDAPVCNGTRPVANLQVFRTGAPGPSNPATTQFDPLEHVALDGSTSTVPNGALTYVWRLVSQPQNGTEQLSGSGPRVALWLKQAGDYVVELVVKDSACQSTPVQVTLHSVPKGAIHVELSWPQYYGDLDLHYIGPGGTLFEAYNSGFCSIAEPCGDTFFDEKTPDWGCANPSCATKGGVFPDGNPANDASLDIDQRWGNGPENTTHMAPFDGNYKVAIHYWCARKCDTTSCSGPFGNGTAIVRVWVNGVKQFEKQQVLQEFQAWDAANISVSNNGKTVTVSDANGTPRTDSRGCLQH